MTTLDCPQCCSVVPTDRVITGRIVLPNGGYHLKASCPYCKAFIKFMVHDPPKMYIGKYKGRLLADIAKDDPAYLRWFLMQEIKKPLRKQIEEALNVVSSRG